MIAIRLGEEEEEEEEGEEEGESWKDITSERASSVWG